MAIKTPPTWHRGLELDMFSYPTGTTPCVACGKPIKITNATKWIRLHAAGDLIVTENEAAEANVTGTWGGEAADCGGWPIGANCLKRHPEIMPYTT